MSIAPHTRLEQYEIIAPIGAGELGEVYQARDTRLDRNVAFKLLPVDYTRDADRVRRFVQEAKAASALTHPNIITVYDMGESALGRYIAMELVSGRSLREVIAEDNSHETLLALGSQMANALVAAHASGITHRGLKPDKIMVRDDGYVKILDFGLARLVATGAGEDEDTLAREIKAGKLLDTVRYMSPEQARGRSVNHSSDIFSLGVIFYEQVAGLHPFTAASPGEMLRAIIHDEPLPPSQMNPRLPAELEVLILRMLQKEARLRPTAAEVESALLEIRRRGEAGPVRNTTDLRQALSALPEADEGDGLDLAHVLFCDIVGYSLMPIDRQTEMMRTLQELVRQTDSYRRAEAARKLVRLPAGDGMALAFLQDPSAPVRCAFEIARALKAHPEIRLRMGAHSGPVFRSTDININRNVVGEGINMAQRVMDCGDAGHILVSRQVADILRLISRWQPYLHDIGVHEVKHGVRLHLFNLHDDELGNPALPSKVQAARKAESLSLEAKRETSGAKNSPAPATTSASSKPTPARQPSVATTPPPLPAPPKLEPPSAPPPQPARSRLWLLAIPAVLALGAIAFFLWNATRTKTPPAAVERELSFALLVQRMRDGQPFREPFESTGREFFEPGWKFRFEFTSPQAGYVYLLNEGPAAKGAIRYQLLYPLPGSAGAPPRLEANQTAETGWYVIGEARGTERIFLIWAAAPVPELEAVRQSVNPADREGIETPAILNGVRQLLRRQAETKPEAMEEGRAHKHTLLRGRGDLLIHMLELDHP